MIGVATFVHGWYMDYIPMFIFSVCKAYPEYAVRVFINEPLPEYVRDQLSFLTGDFRIELIFEDRATSDPLKKPYYLRWLIPENRFDGLDAVFLCDVDFLMLREPIAMHEQRYALCHRTGLPFANFWRRSHPDYPNRVTGWHFFITNPYYEKVGPIVHKVLDDPTFDISNPPSYCYDNGTGERQWGQEALLYQILDLAFGVDDRIAEDRIGFANHHGLHFGPFRGKIPDLVAKHHHGAMAHLGHNIKFWKMTSQIRSLILDPVFQVLVNNLREPKVAMVVEKVRRYFLQDFVCFL